MSNAAVPDASTLKTLYEGKIVSVHGSVVDVRFESHLPSINAIVYAGENNKIVMEVLSQPGHTIARCIALTPTQGLARGMIVKSADEPLKVPVGKETLGRMFNVFGHTVDHTTPLAYCAVFISRRFLYQTVLQNQPSLKQVSKQSMCLYHWNGEARPDCLEAPVWYFQYRHCRYHFYPGCVRTCR